MIKNNTFPKLGHQCSEETKAKLRTAALARGAKPPSRKGCRASEETRIRIGVGHLGGRRSAETKAKMREASLGKTMSMEARSKMGSSKRGMPLSTEHKRKISEALSKEKAPNWKGGITAVNWGLSKALRSTFEYRQWRSDIFTRDNFTCQGCGKRGSYLHAHHKKHLQDIINEYNITTVEQALVCEELWNINNGTTLCKGCHKKRHQRRA